MSSSPPTKTHPLKRILSKQAFRSRTSLDLARPKEAALKGDGSATPGSGIARTLIEDDENRPEETEPETAAVPEESASPAAVEGKGEKRRRMSIGGKIKWFGGAEKKEKSKPVAGIAPVGSGTTLDPTSEIADVPKQETGDPSEDTKPSPEVVANRIRDLLMSAPPFYPTINALDDQTSKLSQLSDGGPIDVIQGTKLFSLLSDSAMMSGSDGQASVWSALDRVSFSFKDNINALSVPSKGKDTSVAHPDNSIMLYVPLIIDENAKVELAEYKLVQVPLDQLDEDINAIKVAGWWPPWGKKDNPAPTPPPTKEVRVWIPSKDKISLQCAWWGYRM
jgi:hypothetical protein